MKVRVNIDNFALEGFTKNEAASFVKEFEQELSRLVSENGTSKISSNVRTLNLSTVRLVGSARSDIGPDVARSIYRSISKDVH